VTMVMALTVAEQPMSELKNDVSEEAKFNANGISRQRFELL
jgi:hypothetical protein